MARVTIDGKEFDTDELSKEALATLKSLQYVRGKMQDLELQNAALHTASNAYGIELRRLLNLEPSNQNQDLGLADTISFDDLT